MKTQTARSNRSTGGRAKRAHRPARRSSDRNSTREVVTEAPNSPAFARHETFAPRFGWLRKGIRAVEENGSFFSQDDAHLRLGVGKNMARAIRYWIQAFGLVEESNTNESRNSGFRPTTFAKQLFGTRGWDPYLENSCSLWLLHWKLVQSPRYATAWHYAFTIFGAIEFTTDSLAHALSGYASATYPTARLAQSSFAKDASCIARMYDASVDALTFTEETMQSPFAELGLVSKDPTSGRTPRYRFEVGSRSHLRSELVAVACLEHSERSSPEARTVALSRLLSDPGSPGMAFKLTGAELTNALEDACTLIPGISLSDSGGLVQFAFREDPTSIANAALARVYSAQSR